MINPTKSLNLAMLCGLVLVAINGLSCCAPDDAIAEVAGNKISRTAVTVPDNVVRKQFYVAHATWPSTADAQELDNRRVADETQLLAVVMRRLGIEEIERQYGLRVTKSEILGAKLRYPQWSQSQVDQRNAIGRLGLAFYGTLNAMNNEHLSLDEAAKKYLATDEARKLVKLAGNIPAEYSVEDTDAYLKEGLKTLSVTYNTPSSISEVKQISDDSIKATASTMNAAALVDIESRIKYDKLLGICDAELAAKDSNFRSLADARPGSIGFSDKHKQVSAIRSNWINDKLRTIPVRIIDHRYDGVLAILYEHQSTSLE